MTDCKRVFHIDSIQHLWHCFFKPRITLNATVDVRELELGVTRIAPKLGLPGMDLLLIINGNFILGNSNFLLSRRNCLSLQGRVVQSPIKLTKD